MKEIRQGSSVIDAQLETGFESGSGFRDAFSKIFGEVPARVLSQKLLKTQNAGILGKFTPLARKTVQI